MSSLPISISNIYLNFNQNNNFTFNVNFFNTISSKVSFENITSTVQFSSYLFNIISADVIFTNIFISNFFGYSMINQISNDISNSNIVINNLIMTDIYPLVSTVSAVGNISASYFQNKMAQPAPSVIFQLTPIENQYCFLRLFNSSTFTSFISFPSCFLFSF